MRRAVDGNPIKTSVHGQPTNMGIFGKHLGFDYSVGEGTPVLAPVAGVIRMQGDSGAKQVGLYIELEGEGHWHRFLHLSRIGVKVGDLVREGQVIGCSGATGIVTGAHLHHDVRKPSAWNASFYNYVNWEKMLADVPPPLPEKVGVPRVDQSVVGKTLYLLPHVIRWRVYATNQQPVVGKEKAFLSPKMFGGLKYRIRALSPWPQVVQIETEMFGIVNIFVDADAQIY